VPLFKLHVRRRDALQVEIGRTPEPIGENNAFISVGPRTGVYPLRPLTEATEGRLCATDVETGYAPFEETAGRFSI
jgi:hypothetical protein